MNKKTCRTDHCIHHDYFLKSLTRTWAVIVQLTVLVYNFTPGLQVRIMYLNQPFLEERAHVNNSYFSLGGRSTASSLTVSFLYVSKACAVRLKLPRQLVLSRKTQVPKNFLLLQPQWPPPAWRCSRERPPHLKSAPRPGSACCHSKLILRPSCNPLTPPRFTPLPFVGDKLIFNT